MGKKRRTMMKEEEEEEEEEEGKGIPPITMADATTTAVAAPVAHGRLVSLFLFLLLLLLLFRLLRLRCPFPFSTGCHSFAKWDGRSFVGSRRNSVKTR